MSLQGFIGALDHTLLQCPLEAAHTTEARSNSSFLSDYVLALTTLNAFPPAP